MAMTEGKASAPSAASQPELNAYRSALRAMRRPVAAAGFFQRNIDPAVPYQMIRVFIPSTAPMFPEISAGRHRFTVRFLTSGGPEARPTQVSEDVEFDLQCCAL